MRERGKGRIINIASIAGKGYRGTSNVAYAGSKGAVIAMTRIGAVQLAPYQINVNAICPGETRTRLVEEILAQIRSRLGLRKTLREQTTSALLAGALDPEDRRIRP